MDDRVLLAKALLGVVMAGGYWLLRSVLDPPAGSQHRAWWIAAVLWTATRPLLFLVVFVGAGLAVQSDVPAFYLPQARAALDGQLVYRDFPSSYGPLFAYLAALPVGLWNDPRSLVLTAIGLELAALCAWAAVGREELGQARTGQVVCLYLCNPLAISSVVLVGQNQIWICAIWGVSAWLLMRRRAALAGGVAILAVTGVKLLGVLALPALWWRAHNKTAFAAGAATIAAASLAPFVLAGADVLQPLRLESDAVTSGNLPYLTTWFGADISGAWYPPILALSLMSAVILIERPWRQRSRKVTLSCAISCVMLVLLLVSRKAFTSYFGMFLMPLTIAVVGVTSRLRSHLAFLLFCGLAMLEPSLWYRWMQAGTLSDVAIGQADRSVLFLAIQLVLLSGYVILLASLVRAAARPASTDTAP